MANPLDCNGQPLPWSDRPCTPGDVDVPICYTVPPDPAILPGVKRITLTAQCTASASVILDEALAPVPGAVEVGCASGSDCECLPSTICAALQALPVQAPGVGDTAVFAGPGGCFLGVPIGGGVAFPLLASDGSCLAPAYSFASSPTSGMWFDPTEGPSGAVIISDNNCANQITVGASIVITAAGLARMQSPTVRLDLTTEFDVSILGSQRFNIDATGTYRVQGTPGTAGQVITSQGVGLPAVWQNAAPAFPLLASDGSCVAPSYSFTSSPDSGLWYDIGTGRVTLSDDNCVSFMSMGGSVEISTGINLDLSITNNVTAIIGGSFDINATGFWDIEGDGARIFGLANQLVVQTSAVTRLIIDGSGAWNIPTGTPGVAGQVLTSNGPGVPPTWQPGGGASLCDQIAALTPITPATGTMEIPIRSPGDGICNVITVQDVCDFCGGGTTFPLLAPDGDCTAPPYAFASDATSGMHLVPGVAGAVNIGWQNCTSRVEVSAIVSIVAQNNDTIEVGASINVTAAVGNVNLTAATDVVATAANSIDLLIGVNSALLIGPGRDWDVGGAGVGALGQVLTSVGGGAPPLWETLSLANTETPGTNITVADTPYAPLLSDYAIFVDTSGGAVTVDLPPAPANGRIINVKKVSTDANNFTVSGNGKTIDGSASITSAAVNRPNLQMLYDSVNNDWRIL